MTEQKAITMSRDEMQEVGVADAFEEADFAILYREVEDCGTTSMQEIFNVPTAYCREIAAALRAQAESKPISWPDREQEFVELLREMWDLITDGCSREDFFAATAVAICDRIRRSPPRCNRCGSSGDVVMLCAGCQSPLPREEQR